MGHKWGSSALKGCARMWLICPHCLAKPFSLCSTLPCSDVKCLPCVQEGASAETYADAHSCPGSITDLFPHPSEPQCLPLQDRDWIHAFPTSQAFIRPEMWIFWEQCFLCSTLGDNKNWYQMSARALISTSHFLRC